MRTGDTIEEPRVVITCRARLTGPHACTRVHSSPLAIRGVSPHRPFTRTPLRFSPSPDYSPLSTCKRRISTRLPTDPRPHLLPVNRFPSPPANLWIAPPLRYHLSKDSTILPGYNVAVREDTTAVGREREGLVYGRPRYTRGRR